MRDAVRTMPAVLGFGAALALMQGIFDYGGGGLTGYEKDPGADEYERKQHLRKNIRRPIEETLRELGEGRGKAIFERDLEDYTITLYAGIYGPGYEERRRERIKQHYGIDVPVGP